MSPVSRSVRNFLLTALAVPLLALPVLASPPPAGPDAERKLVEAINQIEEGKLEEARDSLDELVKEHPNFKLARLFHGELTAALSRKALPPAQRLSDEDKRGLIDEARVRLWQEEIPSGAVPDALLQMQAEYALVVDLPRSRLYLVQNHGGKLKVERQYYAGAGKAGIGKEKAGDNRTPVGIYRVTSFATDSQLPDFYGAGAFKLDYPNEWDRLHHRAGGGIWIHGVPKDTYSRAPKSSEGCVTVPNEDLLALKEFVQPGKTPVVFTDKLEWLSQRKIEDQREEMLERVEKWRDRWSALDTEAYLKFYASDFTTEGMDRKAFAAHKRRVNSGKSSIEVQVSDLELYRYPGNPDLVLARFTQDYRSNNLTRSTRKQQYWRREGDDWQIVRETSG
jgi:murein L,D-transpeptidase YafK